MLTVFNRVIYSVTFVFKFLCHLTVLPVVFAVYVTFFIIRNSSPFTIGRLTFVCLMMFVLLCVTKPNGFSLSRFVTGTLTSRGGWPVRVYFGGHSVSTSGFLWENSGL